MDDVALVKELLPLLQAGGSAALIAGLFIGYRVLLALYVIDKRITRLEIRFGIDEPPPPPPSSGKLARLASYGLVIVAALGLSACTPTMLLGAAYLLQGRSAVQVNAGDTKAGITLTLPKTAVPILQPPSPADPD